MVSKTRFASMDEALGFAVAVADRDFGGKPAEIRITASYTLLGGDGGTEDSWSASIAGITPLPTTGAPDE